MNSFFTFINAILLIASAQGIILGILLFGRKNNNTANRVLSVILLLFSISILLHVLSHSEVIPFHDFHKILISVIYILVAPLIYFYVKFLTIPGLSFQKKDILNFLPFILSIILLGTFIFYWTPEIYHTIKEFVMIVSFLSVSFYIVLSNKDLVSYGKMIRDNYSSIEKINLKWLRIFVVCFSLLWIFAGIIDIFFRAISWDIVWLLCSLIIFMIGYFGFNQPEIFSSGVSLSEKDKNPDISPNTNKIKDTINITAEIKKYEKSALTPETADLYLSKLKKAMEEKKLYLQNDISLTSLSSILGISSHNLSQVLNENLEMSFYDYINSQRIEYSKKLLPDKNYANRNISSIAFDSGFNSLSAFNSAFKKFTGMTPSEFRKNKLL
jgi:AraC-like DNA-binding protein